MLKNYLIFVFLFLLLLSISLGQRPDDHDKGQQRLAEADSHDDASGGDGGDGGRHNIAIVTKELEDFIQEKMKRWHVPGLAIAIIEGDKSWYKGFGYADINGSVPVTPDTLFYSGSTTKSFTAAALSLLIDSPTLPTTAHKPLTWSTPISDLLREDFVLSDPWATTHITLTDILSHRTGYARHDLALGSATSTEDMLRKMRHLPLAAEPRTQFIYSNFMFGVAGHLVSILSGMSLRTFLYEKLWAPWGMHSTYFGLRDVKDSGSEARLAQGYLYVNDSNSFVAIPHTGSMVDEGAGAIISNVKDYARYLRAMMREAAPVSKASYAMLMAPHNVKFVSQIPWTGPVWYGLGWSGSIFRDERAYFHGGLVNGFLSYMLMMPGREFGVVTMLNAQSAAQEVILWKVIYEYFDVPEAERFDFEKGADTDRDRELLPVCKSKLYPGTPDHAIIPLPTRLANFAGVYHDAGYGTIKINLECHKPPPLPSDSPASPTTDNNGCMLIGRPDWLETNGGVTLHFLFEHVTGDYWIAWTYLDQLSEAGQERPVTCLRAKFVMDYTGTVGKFGLNLRLEDIDGPLVWMDRVIAEQKNNSSNSSYITPADI